LFPCEVYKTLNRLEILPKLRKKIQKYKGKEHKTQNKLGNPKNKWKIIKLSKSGVWTRFLISKYLMIHKRKYNRCYKKNNI